MELKDIIKKLGYMPIALHEEIMHEYRSEIVELQANCERLEAEIKRKEQFKEELIMLEPSQSHLQYIPF